MAISRCLHLSEAAAEVEAMADCIEKSVFLVACNKNLKRYCYKIEGDIEGDNNKETRKRKRCNCFSSNYQQKQEDQHELFKRRMLKPIAKGCGIRTNELGKYVAVGPIIYCIGGYRNLRSMTEVDIVLRFDTNHPESGWKMGTPMLKSRGNPQVAAIDGKIYALGGRFDGCKPWGEVFDPSTDKWDDLPEPPIPLDDQFSAVVVDEEEDTKMVVLGSRLGDLYGYNVLTNTWSFLFTETSLGVACNPVSEPPFGPVVVLDMTLYWYVEKDGKHKLEAYDLKKKMWFTGIIEGLEWDGLVTPPIDPSISDISSPSLLYLGGGGGRNNNNNLWCLIWEDYRTYKDSSNKRESTYYKCIDSIKFKVTKRINSRGYGVLDIQIQSSQIHLIHHSLSFQHAFLI